ncbi:UNVERIFIED_ORG: hypothetical protein E4P37_12650 [Bacillus sp. AZ43]
MSRIPEPSPPDHCGGCGRGRPLYLLEGADGDHVHRCRECLRDAFAGIGDDDHAELATAARERDEARAALRTAEEVVVRQKALLETATEMIEEARRWARSLWDDGPASEEPMVLNEPEFAPAWLTADGPRHTAQPPRRSSEVESAAAAHELRLAALDRWLADAEAEWGPITADEVATAAQRLHDRARSPG